MPSVQRSGFVVNGFAVSRSKAINHEGTKGEEVRSKTYKNLIRFFLRVLCVAIATLWPSLGIKAINHEGTKGEEVRSKP